MVKNVAASEMARMRWKGTTKAERVAHSKKMVDARNKKKELV